jgi:hypothetical protein
MPGLSLPGLEAKLRHRLTLHRTYFGPGALGGLVAQARADHRYHRMPLVSVKLPTSWGAVAAGAADTWLHRLIDGLGRLGKPVFLSLHHEPEDDVRGYGRTPADWVAMQRRAMVFASARSAEITILPILMAWTWDPRSGRRPEDWWIPEARAVGIDCYNPWSASGGHPWMSLAHIMRPVRTFAGDMPIVVAEYGCRTDPSRPGWAAQWMTDAFRFAHRHNVIGMSYFDSGLHSPDGPWVLDRERRSAMRWCIQQPEVVQLG